MQAFCDFLLLGEPLARPPSWLPRLHEIRRSVDNSVRSHYGRRDLEQLFELQSRGAGKLLELLPTMQVGTSRLVEREALAAFLEGVRSTEDLQSYMEQVRFQKAGVSHRKLRSLVRRDFHPVSLASLPPSVGLSRGRLEVSFRSVLELAEAMLWLTQVIETDGFAQEFEPEAPLPPESKDTGEIREMFAELESVEAKRATVDLPTVSGGAETTS